MTFRIRRREALLFAGAAIAPVLIAWLQAATVGIGALPDMAARSAASGTGPIGFPAWLRVNHFVNLLFITLLFRSGLQILFDHPRLYWNVHSTPGSEWARFTPIEVPTDRLWTAKDDSRHLTSWVGLPGGRHTIGIARHWHFLSVFFWLGNGLIFVALLFGTGQWRRLVPRSWSIFPEAWTVFVHYATLQMPPEPDGFFAYNPLQQLAYFGVVFVLAPLSLLTGLAMSPALDSACPWYPRLFGNRQVARSLHFLLLLSYVAFIVPHVTMVVLTGALRNFNHIVLGTDDVGVLGLVIGLVGLGVVVLANVWATRVSRHRPRGLQHFARWIVGTVMEGAFGRLVPRAEYRREEISTYFWPNGKLPTSAEWKALAAENFRSYRLKVQGLVAKPTEFSLEELKALGPETHITLHHCIQGWSGIAAWTGIALTKVMEQVQPGPEARFAVFTSFGEGGEGGPYFDVHTIEDLKHPQSILAYEMNYEPLPIVYGAPLRLRVENQLGFKQVKWIKTITFVASYRGVSQGEGGYNEDQEFFGCRAEI